MKLHGSSAIVTGGAGGLGEATVRTLVGAGAKVVISDFSEEKGRKLEADLGGNAVFVQTDVTDEDSTQAAIDAAQALAPLRVAVTVHGGKAIGGRLVNKEGKALELQGFRDTIDGYLTGTYNVMRLAAARIAANDIDEESGTRGVIINTASIAGFEGQVGQVPYAAAKGGVIAMTITAARDMSVAGVRVMCIAPGTFFTPAYGMPEDKATEYFGKGIPFPARMGSTEEYAKLVAAIVENDYLNGETIRIDAAHRFGLK